MAAAGIATARLDCLVLLEDATGKDRSWLIAHPEYLLQGPALNILNAQVQRREKHEPLAYVRGKSEFYGREFKVSKDTLEPRPETETMIDLLKELIHKSQKPSLLKDRPLTDGGNVNWHIVDVGSGSGCLGITAKLELPGATVLATDISSSCIKIAKQNAKTLGADVNFYQGDLLQPLPSTVYRLPTTLLANLPYVPDSHTINQAAMFEPKIAIFGGEDGLDLYRQLFRQIAKISQKPAYIFTESLPFQHEALAQIAKNVGYKQILAEDFILCFQNSGS